MPAHPLGLLANVRQNAAIHIEDVAVDEVGRIGSEEHRRSLQILGLAPARGRSLGDDELVKRMTAAVRLTLAQSLKGRCIPPGLSCVSQALSCGLPVIARGA